MGASLLVEMTNNAFHQSPNGDRVGSVTLEYLVSSMSTSRVSEPADAIYAFLAIAKDAVPTVATPATLNIAAGHQIKALGSQLASQPYTVDYQRSYVEVCKDFIEFSIDRSEKSHALDIICRPWAQKVKDHKHTLDRALLHDSEHHWEIHDLPSWIRTIDDSAFSV